MLKKIWNHGPRKMKRIKHNDLTHYFMTPHEDLPASYLASCEKFFKGLSAKQRAASIEEKAESYKLQATSFKRHEKDTMN